MTTDHDAPTEQASVGELDEPAARKALAVACGRVGISPADAALVRIGSNAVFRLAGSPRVIARVARSTDQLPEAKKQVAVARWLTDEHYPTAPAFDVEQPQVAAGRPVTFWMSVSDREEYAPIVDVARLIRDLHKLPAPPASVNLPVLAPFGPASAGIPSFSGLQPDDATYLIDRILWARETFDALPFALPIGHIHGDANVGNIIRDSAGSPVLIDLDSFSHGPREWDLIQTAIFADRFGWHTPDEYRSFVDIYGYDVTKWDAYPVLAEMRELAMTSWMSRKATTSRRSAAEAAKRIFALRTGASRADWSPY